MKRKILLLVFTTLFAISFCACGQTNDKDNKNPQEIVAEVDDTELYDGIVWDFDNNSDEICNQLIERDLFDREDFCVHYDFRSGDRNNETYTTIDAIRLGSQLSVDVTTESQEGKYKFNSLSIQYGMVCFSEYGDEEYYPRYEELVIAKDPDDIILEKVTDALIYISNAWKQKATYNLNGSLEEKCHGIDSSSEYSIRPNYLSYCDEYDDTVYFYDMDVQYNATETDLIVSKRDKRIKKMYVDIRGSNNVIHAIRLNFLCTHKKHESEIQKIIENEGLELSFINSGSTLVYFADSETIVSIYADFEYGAERKIQDLTNVNTNEVMRRIANMFTSSYVGILLPDIFQADYNAKNEADSALELYHGILELAPAINGEHDELNDASFGYEQNLDKFGEHFESFMLHDVDRDGVPELIAQSVINFRWAPVSVYTYKNGELSLVKDPFNSNAQWTFEQNSSANGAYNAYICEYGHIHNVWSGTTPAGNVEENNAYMLEGTELVPTKCALVDDENRIYYHDSAKTNSKENAIRSDWYV